MKKKIWGVLLSVAVLVTTVNFPTTAGAEENKGGADASGIVVKVSDDMNGSNANESDEIQTVQISAQNQSNMDAVVRIFLLNEDKETADTEVEIPNLCDKDQITDETVQTEMAETLKSALTLESGTNSALDAQWIEKKDDSGNVTAKYLEAALPAGTAAAFDMQLMYRTDEENYTKKTIVRAKAFVDEQDVTEASDVEDEDNEAEVKWEVVKVEEESEAAGEDEETAGSAAKVSRIAAKSAAENNVSLMSEEDGIATQADVQLDSQYVYLDITGMDNWSAGSVYIFVDTWGGFAQGNYDSSTGYIRWKISDYTNTDHYFGFSCNNVWTTIESNELYRSDMIQMNFSEAGGRVFSWDGTSTTSIKNHSAYILHEGAAFDPDDHTWFAGETMWFKDNSDENLSAVTAVFYEKDDSGTLQEVTTITMQNRGDGEFSTSIPSDECSYVQFVNPKDNDKILGDTYSNFYGQGTGEDGVESFTFDSSSMYCYQYYGTADTSTWGTRNVSGTITIYYDASLSALSYTGDTTANNNSAKPIPDNYGNVWCRMAGTGQTSKTLKMNLVSGEESVYQITVPAGYTQVRFASYENVDDTSGAANGDATPMTTIPGNLKNPCFFGDSGDDVAYTGGNRDGYWGEYGTVRNAEKGKGSTVTDIPTGTFTRDQDKLYVNTTLYDFYTDYELNGNNRDGYDSSVNINSHRIYQPFRQFNQALSEYYKDKNVVNPLYWGNFQNYENQKFTGISDTLNLFGFDKDSATDLYHKFFYNNNSMWGRDGNNFDKSSVEDAKTGKVATQGLASNALVDSSLALDTGNSSSVPAPFFDEDFLEGENNKNTVLGKVYKNVTFPFVKMQLGSLSRGDDNAGTQYGTVDYWYYNSNTTELAETPENANLRLYYDQANRRYFLDSAGENGGVKGEKPDGGGTQTSEYNYFPFNDTKQSGDATRLNYGFGQKFEITFRLTSDGTVKTNTGEKVPIEFNFSGDDDVWVYIDDELVLDVGGGHGKVTGRINFEDMTSYVSAVKIDSSSGGAEANVTTKFPGSLKNDSNFYSKEHTLTMYYMERGLWESNLRLSFNFSDENEFAVEKEVDESDVNEIFKEESLGYDLFKDASVFPFVIQNQATHYKETEVTTGEDTVLPVTYNDSFGTGQLEKPSSGSTVYNIVLEQVANYQGKDNVVHWKAAHPDAGGANKNKRWGIIKPEERTMFDASSQDAYLRFSLYYAADDTPTLSNMYIELEDSKGNTLSDYLSGKTYGTSSLTKREWNTIQVDLSKLTRNGDFDFSSIVNIKFNYNYEKDIYLDDFTFIPSVIVAGNTGFVTAQEDIPSYGSVESGTLKYPEGAVYEVTDGNGEEVSYRIGSDGMFALADGETATFSDQFRRGSYIALTETVDQNLFDTTWTMYENGEEVTTIGPGSTVDISQAVSDLTDVASTVLRDGRQEVYKPGTDSNGQQIDNIGYTTTGWAKNQDKLDNQNTIVFRSYASPDNESAVTKLKVKYTNKVKTGSIVIKKAAAAGSEELSGDYTFRVTFINIAGMSLEQAPITETYTLQAGGKIRIDGIPAGTVYTVEEIKISDESVLEDAEFNSNNMNSDRGYDNVTKTVEGKMVVFGTEDAGTEVPQICTEEKAEAVIQFNNTLKPAIDISLTKEWADKPNDVDYPASIKVQLQRKTANTEWESVDYDGQGNNYVTITPNYDGEWTFEFTNLDQYSDYPTNSIPYQYRIVELDEDNKPIESGGYLDNLFKVTYSNEISPTEGKKAYDYTITNTYGPEGTVKVIKKNGEGQFLEGAEFVLYTDKDCNTIATDSEGNELKGTTEVDRVLIFDNIPAGTKDKPMTYYLKELKTAAGYVLLKEPIKVKLPYEYHVGDIVNGDEVTEDGMTWSLTYTIVNDKAFDLPASGLSGIGPIAAAGIAIVVIAGAVFAARNIKGQRAASNRRKRRPH